VPRRRVILVSDLVSGVVVGTTEYGVYQRGDSKPFLLHYYGGFPIREVATLLHRPEGTIKADLFAARAKLKTALGERDA